MISRSIPGVAALVALASAACIAGCSSDRSAVSSRAGTKESTTAVTPPQTSPDSSRVVPTARDSVQASAMGVGVVRFGMTVDAAARAAGGTVAHRPEGSCGFVSFRALPRGVRFMVSYDTVVRADVDSATIATDAGARVGMTEDSVQHVYARRLTLTPHKYVSGAHYLTLVPGVPADTLHRIIFETDGTRVTRYRAGMLPYVANVEGCG